MTFASNKILTVLLVVSICLLMIGCSPKFESAIDYMINGDREAIEFEGSESISEEVQNDESADLSDNNIIDHGLILLDVTAQNLASAYKRYGVTSTGIIVFESRLSDELEFGDRIISANGIELSSSSDFEELISGCSIGDVVIIRIEREGATIDVALTLKEKIPDEVSFY